MTASVLLVIGYAVALATLEAATASITAGWLVRQRPVPAAVNGAALVGFAIAWLITGKRGGQRGRKAH